MHRKYFGMATAVGVALSLSLPAAAEELPPAEQEQQQGIAVPEVYFSLMEGPTGDHNGVVSAEALLDAGVSQVQLDQAMTDAQNQGLSTAYLENTDSLLEETDTYDVFLGTQDVTEQNSGDFASDLAFPDGRGSAWNIKYVWNDRGGKQTVVRKGAYNPSTGKGWGLAKVVKKHNLSWRALRGATTRNLSQAGSGSSRVYYARVDHYRCRGFYPWRKCWVDDSTTVKVVHENKTNTVDYKARGVITAHCTDRGPQCPRWVKRALNV